MYVFIVSVQYLMMFTEIEYISINNVLAWILQKAESLNTKNIFKNISKYQIFLFTTHSLRNIFFLEGEG